MDPEALVDSLKHEHAQERVDAALQLGHARPAGAANALFEALAREGDVFAAAAYCAALEMIGDRGVAPRLVAWLEKCPDDHVWDVAHTIGRLLAVDPLVTPNATPAVRRRIWLEALGQPTTPAIANISADANGVRFTVDAGAGRIRIDYDPPALHTSWPRWGRSLIVGGQPLYSIGSTCGTCETALRLVGWPADRAVVVARDLSASMEDSADVSPAWVEQWAPILKELQTGHYLAVRVQMPIERVDVPGRSWLSMRERLTDDRLEEPAPEQDAGEVDWPGAAHYQGPGFASDRPACWLVLPSQDMNALDEGRVAHYVRTIGHGARPTPLALAWLEDREVHCDRPERFIVLCVLDGHHKIEAYVRCAQPVPIVTLFNLENTWGPPEDRAAPVIEAIAQLKRERGVLSRDLP